MKHSRTFALMALVTASCVVGLNPTLRARAPDIVPSIDQTVQLKRVGSPAISPDGTLVAYTVREANWDENAFETEIWLVNVRTGEVRQLTNATKSSSSPDWSPDGQKLAFVSDRDGKQQIYLIDPGMGEAAVLTAAEDGVSRFAWSPDGKSIAYTAVEPKSEAQKERDKRYGEFEIVDGDHRMTHLYVIDVATKDTRRLTEGAFAVGSFSWSPDGSQIAFDHRINSDPASSGTANISIAVIADRTVRALVTADGPDSSPVWSPDGSQVAFESAMANPWFFFTNTRIATIPASGGSVTVLSESFDEDPSLIAWSSDGLFFGGSERTASHLYRLDPTSKKYTKLAAQPELSASSFSFNRDFGTVAFVGSGPNAFPEVFVAPVATMQARKLTDLGSQIASWSIGTREVISWKSTDGTLIEGVLHKPSDFQAGKRYPLLVVIHGGPTGISRPIPVAYSSVYPFVQWLAKGAVILEPNYRGSAGYGEKFRSLNVRNLGVGDAWDVISGIDYLIAQGIADKDRVGAMGWSQGGYISAFLTTHDSDRFKAISVGAGISDWMTYYVNTDIHPFTRQYLKATPWDDPEIYAKTSPITYIKNAKAPTLIQHGENDQRVPIPNAYELYQGLQDQGVPVRLIVYKGFGHGLTKPKAQRAAAEHNYEWFAKYIWGEGEKTSSGRP